MHFFLSILATIGFSAFEQAVETANPNISQITTCPEIEKKDIFFVGRFLVDPNWEAARKKAGIENYIFNKSEIGTLGADTPEKLRGYWKKRGVVIITDPEICHRIEEVISMDSRLNKYQENYRKVYFKVKDKYVIDYNSKDTLIGGPGAPILVLDKNYNIIGYF